MKSKTTKFIVRSAVIAAVYATLTLAFAPISFGHNVFQLRIAEMLTVLPMFISAAIPGLFVGCIISNIIGGFGLIDIVFGSLATLMAAYCSYRVRKNIYLVPLFPVLFNALIVGGYLYVIFGGEHTLLVMMGWVGLGQVLACYGLGLPLAFWLRKNPKILG